MQAATNQNVVFEPLWGTSQELALNSPCDITVYCGTRGPGKTLTQLMRFRKRVGQGYGPYWRGLILDREFKNLSDIRAQSHRFFPKFDDGCKFLSSASEFKWVWPSGEELLLRHAKKLSDYDQFHGWEIPSLNYNEITKHPTSELYDKLMSINRSSYRPEKDGWIGGTVGEDGIPRGPNGELPPPIPLEVFITTNPSGSGHNWCKQEFIDPAPYGQIVRKTSRIFNPQTRQEEDVVKTQVALFGSYKENKYLDPKYVAELDAIKDPNLRRAWLYGDWDVTAGGALDDLWRKEKHILPRFKVPKGWRIDRSMDWGSSHPFAVAWWAEANGEEATLPNGAKFCPPRGTLIQIGEIYATERVGSNKGLKWGPFLCAEKIINYEMELMRNGFIVTQPYPGPADNQIRNVIDSESDTIETKFAKKGVKWIDSDKSPGSRKNGLVLIRDRLEAVLDDNENPGLYVMDNCRYSIATVPSIPRDEDNLDDVDCWIAGTMVATPNGSKPIELIKAGETVNTPIGPKLVEKSYISGNSDIVHVTLENGKVLEGTPGHKIFVCGKGLVPLEQLQPDWFVTEEENQCLQNVLFTMALLIAGMRDDHITVPVSSRSKQAEQAFTAKYGLMLEEKFQKAGISTMLTAITIITCLKISSASRLPTMLKNIMQSAVKNLLQGLMFGEQPTKERQSLETMPERCTNEPRSANLRAEIVASNLLLSILLPNSVQTLAEKKQGIGKFLRIVRFAIRSFGQNVIRLKRSKPVRVLAVGHCAEKMPVYNLTIEDARLYYANGILSSNTAAEDHMYDAWRYRCLKGANRLAAPGTVKIRMPT